MNTADTIPLLLLAVLGICVGMGLALLAWVMALRRRALRKSTAPIHHEFAPLKASGQRPNLWLAVRSRTTEEVRSALGLDRFTPCSWREGMKGSHEFFISPRVSGWIIITGLALPNPSDDIDACFTFLTGISKKLGHVQFFYLDPVWDHHAWARIDEGCITRAYAWTGDTVWNQGPMTLPETDLGLKCYPYGDHSATIAACEQNTLRIPLLAARWSLDPAEVKDFTTEQATGLAGESAWT
jgi:hypothetical protein